MDVEVDIVDFRVPVENRKTLFVWNLQPSLSQEQIQEHLSAVFSAFGPLYMVRVCHNIPPAPRGSYALIKFYSAAHAAKAQRRTDERTLFQDVPLKVKLSSRHNCWLPSHGGRPLSHAHCVDLANHCLGFNGWSSHIITLKELREDEYEEVEVEEEQQQSRGGGTEEARRMKRLHVGCVLQLSFPQHGRSSRGTAVLLHCFQLTGPDKELQQRCRLLRAVKHGALVQAFSSVLLILLGNGKVMVEVRQDAQQLVPQQADGIMQVNPWSCPGSVPDEGDDENDLSI